MRSAVRGALIALLALTGPAVSQGNDSATPAAGAAEPSQGAAEVQIGAGSTSSVTTGSSGPKSAGAKPLAALPAGFSIVPPQNGFFGPGALPIRRPDRLRCDVIGDDSARALCQSRTGATDGSGRGANQTGARTP
jgi:hypothetical protein